MGSVTDPNDIEQLPLTYAKGQLIYLVSAGHYLQQDSSPRRGAAWPRSQLYLQETKASFKKVTFRSHRLAWASISAEAAADGTGPHVPPASRYHQLHNKPTGASSNKSRHKTTQSSSTETRIRSTGSHLCYSLQQLTRLCLYKTPPASLNLCWTER